MTSHQLSTVNAAECDIAFDNLTRQLYATDASIYQIEPRRGRFPAQRCAGQLCHPGGS